jgi:hypothetical protein
MILQDMVEAAVATIKQTLEGLSEDVEKDLTPARAERVTRVLKEGGSAACREALRVYLESKDTVAESVEVDGEVFGFKYVSSKSFLSLFGPTAVARRVYQNARDTRTVVPLDRAWGMEKRFLTIEVQESVAYALAHMSPVEVMGFFRKCMSSYCPHATQIKAVGAEVAPKVREGEAALRARLGEQEEVPEKSRALAVSLDGANVLMREAGAAKRGGPAERPGLGRTQSDDSAYRNALVGVVSLYGAVKDPEKNPTPPRLKSVYTAQMPEPHAPTFKRRFEAEVKAAHEKAPPDLVRVVLCDGARALWKYLRGSLLFRSWVLILDYYHAAEHLSLAAEALFGKGTQEAKDWFNKYADKLLEEDGAVEALLRSMKHYAGLHALPAARRKVLSAQRHYFLTNRAYMAYADFRRRGLPIGSGPVEAACKTLVKARLCQSGMRWTVEGGQNILDLRTYVKSKRWEPMWETYKERANAA